MADNEVYVAVRGEEWGGMARNEAESPAEREQLAEHVAGFIRTGWDMKLMSWDEFKKIMDRETALRAEQGVQQELISL